jgi:hypothetical protein
MKGSEWGKANKGRYDNLPFQFLGNTYTHRTRTEKGTAKRVPKRASVRAINRIAIQTDNMGFETDISHGAMIFKAPFPALEAPWAFHFVNDLLKFVCLPLPH